MSKLIPCLYFVVVFVGCNKVLRKQARKLENDIDMKLVAYSKIGTSTMPSTSAADTAPLLNEHVFDSLSMEIEQMLEKVVARRSGFVGLIVWCSLQMQINFKR